MDDEEEYTTPAYPWSWKSALVYVGDFIATTLSAGAAMVEGISVSLAASVNHDIYQREFRNQAALEIESITNPEE